MTKHVKQLDAIEKNNFFYMEKGAKIHFVRPFFFFTWKAQGYGLELEMNRCKFTQKISPNRFVSKWLISTYMHYDYQLHALTRKKSLKRKINF